MNKLPPMLPTRQLLCELYLEWRNDYLTVEKFAEHKGLHPAEAEVLIRLAHVVLMADVPDA